MYHVILIQFPLSRPQMEISSTHHRAHLPPERPEELRGPVQRKLPPRGEEALEGGGKDFRLPRLHERSDRRDLVG